MIEVKQCYSPELARNVTLRIYTPPGYANNRQDYPLAIFFDGQNLFDKATSAYGHIWALDQVMEQIGMELIVVGIDSLPDPGRMEEYSPWPVVIESGKPIERPERQLGKQTARFIVQTLLPWIEKHYRCLDDRLIAGASLGGVMSLYVGINYPTVFSKVLAMSTAGWLFQSALENLVRQAEPKYGQRFYIDTGTAESADQGFDQRYVESNRRLAKELEQVGLHYSFMLEANGRHNESAWQRRLPAALRWLYAMEESRA